MAWKVGLGSWMCASVSWMTTPGSPLISSSSSIIVSSLWVDGPASSLVASGYSIMLLLPQLVHLTFYGFWVLVSWEPIGILGSLSLGPSSCFESTPARSSF